LRIRAGNGLLLLNLFVIVLVVAIIFLPSNVLRIILGLPFVLFFPGYALIAALFTRKEGMSGIERVALSLGMSIAVVPLIGLILNYTLGITLESVLYSIASFILIMSIIAWVRIKRLPEQERFGIELHPGTPGWSGGTWDKTLSIILIVSILGALGIMGYVMVRPKVGETFTEFYILGVEGKTADYPEELVMGEEGEMTIGIINREHRTVSYQLESRINGMKNSEVGPIILKHEERWEGKASFVPKVSGDNQKVEFLLYKDGEVEPYLEPLRLWVDVRE